MNLTFEQILQAWKAQDPHLVDYLVTLANTNPPPTNTPIADDELTFEWFLAHIFSNEFRAKDTKVQFAERIAMIAKLEADNGAVPLPDRFKIHLLLTQLWADKSPYARVVLKQAIDKLPLTYGVWKGLKAIFKDAERCQDYEIFCQIACRIDCQLTPSDALNPISKATKTYMRLRAWRVLRNLGESAPLFYPHVASQMLRHYPSDMTRQMREQTWVLNHICYHNQHSYGAKSFGYVTSHQLFNDKGRAFAETWQRDYQPLWDLLITAKNEQVRQFATDSLMCDFKLAFKDIDVAKIQTLSSLDIHSIALDKLIVWLIEKAVHLEQANFVVIGLHDVVLKLLFSDCADAHQYAIAYAQSYAKDLPITSLILLCECKHKAVRDFAMTQILARHPRRDIGIDVWGQLLDSQHHHAVASKQLIAHFNAKDLTADWFGKRLLHGQSQSITFACEHLTRLHDIKALGVDYFVTIANHLDDDYHKQAVMTLVLNALKKLGTERTPPDIWQVLLLHPLAQDTLVAWLDDGTLSAQTLPISYWQTLAYLPDWQKSAWVQQLKNNSNRPTTWQTRLEFNEHLAQHSVLAWLADVRLFTPPSLGLDWLMTLVHSHDSVYRNFAIDRINKGFIPADFAPQNSPANTKAAPNDMVVDLHEQSFLFTGKMQSMPRSQAEDLVKNANGKISGAVNGKLDFLVIGDDGSPLYGNGRKGSKQIKAESLIEGGASLKIISETAFLQMLSGQNRQADDNAMMAGAIQLWQMATDDPTAFVSELAIRYIACHHEQLCMALTDRPVDPDAVIPQAFFSADRIIPTLQSGHARLRELGLQLVRYELASWQLTAEQWLIMAESQHNDVQVLLNQALLELPSLENRRYHLGEDKLTQEILYALINSQKRFARKLGMTLLMRYAKFQDPQTLYYLTESTDREVRYSAVKMLWQYYRKRAISPAWQPSQRQEHDKAPPSVAITDKYTEFYQDFDDDKSLLLWLKRSLFELPPARLPIVKEQNNPQANKAKFYNGKVQNLPKITKTISASRAKVALIETFKDVALADGEFAQAVLPILQAFTLSSGKLESQACLVATTQIKRQYPALAC